MDGTNIGNIFYKEGITYFRSSLNDANELINTRFVPGLNTLPYKDLQKIITLTPVEKSVTRSERCITYFQPDSARLDKMLLTFHYQHKKGPYFQWFKKVQHSGIIRPSLYQIVTSNDQKI